MDAAQALADLVEISTQIETAVLVDAQGKVAATNLADASRADSLARAARDLLAASEESMSGSERSEKLVQLQAATPEGCVFVARDDEEKQAWGRPVGLQQMPDGALLVSDDGGNRIWRISYKQK